MTVPLENGTYEACCDECDWTFALASETQLAIVAAKHSAMHAERERLRLAIARAAAREPRDFRDRHRHSAACTQESCPGARYFCSSYRCVPDGAQHVVCAGHAVPAREALVAKRRR